MEQIIEAFGIDGRLIVIQIVNFGLLLLALWYFLYTPVLNIIDRRQKKIEQGVKDAEAATRELEAADAKKSDILTEANVEAEAVVKRARDHAEKKGAKIVSDAQERGERTLLDAKTKAEEMKRRAQKESEKEVAKAAILAAEKILRERT